jgi:hypothetical protein
MALKAVVGIDQHYGFIHLFVAQGENERVMREVTISVKISMGHGYLLQGCLPCSLLAVLSLPSWGRKSSLMPTGVCR